MTQRPCRVGDTVSLRPVECQCRSQWFAAVIQEFIDQGWCAVTRCGQFGKAVPSECRCFEELQEAENQNEK